MGWPTDLQLGHGQGAAKHWLERQNTNIRVFRDDDAEDDPSEAEFRSKWANDMRDGL